MASDSCFTRSFHVWIFIGGHILGIDLSNGRVRCPQPPLHARADHGSVCHLMTCHAFRVKTKVQQRALAGEKYRGVIETLTRLIRGEFIVPPLMTTPLRVFLSIPSTRSPGSVVPRIMLIPVLPSFFFYHQVLTRKIRSHCWQVSVGCIGDLASALFGVSLRMGFCGRSSTLCRTISIDFRSADPPSQRVAP